MQQQLVLQIEWVLHLVQLLRASDHIGHHHFRLGPGEIFVDWQVLRLELKGQMVGQSEQLGEADGGRM